jgi:hypothetical protein
MRPWGRQSSRSTRLTFTYDESGLRLVRRTRRPKGAPVGDDLDRAPGADRIWVEVNDARGSTIYRLTLRDPLRRSVEVFSPDGHIDRVPRAPTQGVLTVVVPDDRRASVVVVVAGPDARIAQPALAGEPGTRRELIRIAADDQQGVTG